MALDPATLSTLKNWTIKPFFISLTDNLAHEVGTDLKEAQYKN
jgi:hypothetical protein